MSIEKRTEYVTTKKNENSVEIIINQAIEDLIIENVIDDSVDKSNEIIINQTIKDSINKRCNKKNGEDINMSELESIKGSLSFSEKQLRELARIRGIKNYENLSVKSLIMKIERSEPTKAIKSYKVVFKKYPKEDKLQARDIRKSFKFNSLNKSLDFKTKNTFEFKSKKKISKKKN